MKKHGKRILTAALALALGLSLAACGDGGGNASQPSAAPATGGGAAAPAPAPVAGENAWPAGDVTVYIPAAAGGGTDVFARIVVDYLKRETGANFTVVNMDSGSGMVAFETVRNSAPDGATIMFWHSGFYVTHYSGMYDYAPNEDFSPLVVFEGLGDDGKTAFVVKGDSPWNSLADVAEAAKASPDTITYGCSVGGSAQLIAEMFMQAAGVELRLVDTASQTDKITGVAGGNVSMSAVTYKAAKQYQESGDLKIIGIVDKEGTADAKSAVEQGYEDCYFTQQLCVFGPGGMDEGLRKAINGAFQGMMEDADTYAALESAGFLNGPMDYEDSLEVFGDFDTVVKGAAANIAWN